MTNSWFEGFHTGCYYGRQWDVDGGPSSRRRYATPLRNAMELYVPPMWDRIKFDMGSLNAVGWRWKVMGR